MTGRKFPFHPNATGASCRRPRRFERRPIDKLEDEPIGLRRLLHAVNDRDVRMIQRRQYLRFALEAREAIGIGGKRLGQHFDGHVTIQPRVARAIHLSHPSRARSETISYAPRRSPRARDM
jgi:hypothetical protein